MGDTDKDIKAGDVKSSTHGNDSQTEKPLKGKRVHFNPVDQGWSWVILACVFSLNFSLMGIFRSYGVLFVPIQQAFDAEASVVSLIPGIQAACFSFSAFFTMTFLIKMTSVRNIIRLGTFLCAVGFCLSFFANSIVFLLIFQSLLCGIGMSMSFGPGFVLLGQYFNKRRALAIAFANTGGSVGTLVMPLVIRYLMEEYTLNGTYLLLGAIFAQNLIVSNLLTPPAEYKPPKGYISEMDSFVEVGSGNGVDNEKGVDRRCVENDDRVGVVEKDRCSDGCSSREACELKKKSRHETKQFLNTEEIHYSEMNTNSSNLEEIQLTLVQERSHLIPIHSKVGPDSSMQCAGSDSNDTNLDTNDNRNALNLDRNGSSLDTNKSKLNKEEETVSEKADHCVLHARDVISTPELRPRTYSESEKSRMNHDSTGNGDVTSQPFSRPTYQRMQSEGDKSELETPFLAKKTPSNDLNVSVLYLSCEMIASSSESQPTQPDEESVKPVSRPPSRLTRCTRMFFDPELMRTPLFWLLLGYIFFGGIGFNMPASFMPPLALEKGMGMSGAALLMTVMGALDIASRLVPGFVAHMKWLRPQTMVFIAYFILGTVFQFTAFYNDDGMMTGMAVAVGLFSGVYVSMIQIITMDFVGLDKFPAAFGMVQATMGSSVASWLPFLGYLRDVTGTYVIPFHVGGACMYVSASLLLLEPLVRRLGRKQKS